MLMFRGVAPRCCMGEGVTWGIIDVVRVDLPRSFHAERSVGDSVMRSCQEESSMVEFCGSECLRGARQFGVERRCTIEMSVLFLSFLKCVCGLSGSEVVMVQAASKVRPVGSRVCHGVSISYHNDFLESPDGFWT